MLTPILLYGFLRKKYGKRHEYLVRNPREAVALLRANYPELTTDLIGYEPGFRVVVGDDPVTDEKELSYPCAQQAIKIIPAVAGREGVGKIILGVALIFLAPYAIPFFGAAVATGIGAVGWSLVLGGISNLLFSPHGDDGPSENPENAPSYAFDGPVNTVAQGQPVPIGYGKLRVGGHFISAGIFVETVLPVAPNSSVPNSIWFGNTNETIISSVDSGRLMSPSTSRVVSV
jgi:predicted phage tail protein